MAMVAVILQTFITFWNMKKVRREHGRRSRLQTETIRARVKIQMRHDKSEAAVWAREAPGIQMREPSTLHSS